MLAIASLLAIGFATLMPEPPAKTGSHLCLACGSLGIVNAVLNVFLFVPLGVGLALYGIDWKRAIVFACALSTSIEITQFLAIPGRYSTVGDVITNTLGGALGFALGRYAENLLRPTPRIASRLLVGWSLIWLTVQLVSSYGFAISMPTSQYYGQIARRLGSYDVFRGRVLSASVGALSIPNTSLADSRSVRDALLGGAEVATAVTPASPTDGVAPIVRVADNKGREITVLAQRGTEAIFGVHTGASVLKLRAPLFALDAVFPTQQVVPPDTASTVFVRGRYLPRGVQLEAETSGTHHVAQVPITASLGWTFWLPFEWLITGTRVESILSFLWLFGLAIPLGYWSLAADSLPRRSRQIPSVSIAAFWIAVLAVGLGLLPMAFGLRVAGVSDWLACLVGILFGRVAVMLLPHHT